MLRSIPNANLRRIDDAAFQRHASVKAGIALTAAAVTALCVAVTPPPVLLVAAAVVLAALSAWGAWRRGQLITGRLRSGWQLVCVMSCIATIGFVFALQIKFTALISGIMFVSMLTGGIAAILLRPAPIRPLLSWRFGLDLSIATLAVGMTARSAVLTGEAGGTQLTFLTSLHIALAIAVLLLLVLTNLRGGPGTASLATLRTSGALAAVALADLVWMLSAAHEGDTTPLIGLAAMAAAFALLAIAVGRERRHGSLPAPSVEAGSALRHPAWWMALVAPAAISLGVEAATGDESVALPSLGVAFVAIGLAMLRQAISVSDARGYAFAWQRQIERDPLTGLLNHRSLLARLDDDLRASAAERPYSLALLDVDELDRVNHRFGSVVGDHALSAIASCIQRSCRMTDLVARYAGDEFVILLPGVSTMDARVIGDRVRAAVDRLHYRTGPDEREAVGVSVGVATTEQPSGMTAPRLIAAGEAALAKAKRVGLRRVRAIDADELIDSAPVVVERRRLLVVYPTAGRPVSS